MACEVYGSAGEGVVFLNGQLHRIAAAAFTVEVVWVVAVVGSNFMSFVAEC
jgi:hypothetical protein